MRFNIRKERSNSFGSDTNLWEIGNATGTFGSYKALKIVSPGTYPMTIAVTADGYEDVTFKVTKDTSSYPYTYTATVVSTPSGEKTYTATAAAATNGTVSLSATEGIQAGATVTVTATPDAGYEVEAVNVNGVSGASVDVQNTEGVYTFTMPSENVTVAATFRETAPVEPGSIDLSQVSMETDFLEMSGIWSLQMQMVMWQQLPMLKSTEHPGRNHLSNRRPEENILLIQKIIRLYFLRKISVEVQTHRF